MLNLKEEKENLLNSAWTKLSDKDQEKYAELQKEIERMERKKDGNLDDKKEEFDVLSKKKLSKKDKYRLTEIDDEIAPLKKFLDDAASHRQQIKLEIGLIRLLLFCFVSLFCFGLLAFPLSLYLESLRADEKKCVLIVDFTKFGMVDKGNVHCFVVSVLSKGKNKITGNSRS